MSYLRGACGLNRMDGESSESVYGRFGDGMNCGVAEVVKHGILRWLGQLKRMGRNEMTKWIYRCGVDAVTCYKMR